MTSAAALEPEKLTAKQVAARLGIPVRSVYELPITRYDYGPRTTRWDRADVENYLADTPGMAPLPLAGVQTLEAEQIVARSVPCFQGCAVYFLIEGDEIVYVGKAKNVAARLSGHCRDGKKFTRIAFHECTLEQLDALEGYYILKYRPRDNKIGK